MVNMFTWCSECLKEVWVSVPDESGYTECPVCGELIYLGEDEGE